MKLIKQLLAVALLAAALTGCSDDPAVEDPINNPANGYLVSETYQNGVLSSKLEYDDDNRLLKLLMFNNEGSLTGTTICSYNDNGQLVSQAVHSIDQDVVIHEFEYNNNGRIKKSMMRMDAEAIATLSYEYIGNQVIANGWAISGVQFVQRPEELQEGKEGD